MPSSYGVPSEIQQGSVGTLKNLSFVLFSEDKSCSRAIPGSKILRVSTENLQDKHLQQPY